MNRQISDLYWIWSGGGRWWRWLLVDSERIYCHWDKLNSKPSI